jgi:hypothetical protein
LAITFGNFFLYDTTIIVSGAHDKKVGKNRKKARWDSGRKRE